MHRWPIRGRRISLLRLQMTTACRRTFRCFIRAVSWIPVIFVSLLIAWAYYVYVYVMNISGERKYTKPWSRAQTPFWTNREFRKGSGDETIPSLSYTWL